MAAMATETEKKDRIKPFASESSHQLRSDDDDLFLLPLPKLRHKHKYIKLCGCFVALLLILAVIAIILAFTLFHIHPPRLKIHSISFPSGFSPDSDGRVILVATFSVKNPNVASFKYAGTTTKIYYDGDNLIGEGELPPGEVEARRTTMVNVTAEIMTKEIDLKSGDLKITCIAVVSGRVNIIGISKKNLVVKMNCDLTYDGESQMILGEDDCDEHVEIPD